MANRFLLLILVGGLCIEQSNACTCREEQEVHEAFKTSELVVIARVIAVEMAIIEPSTAMKKYTVIAEQTFKGKLSTDTVFIYTGVNSAACGSNFTVGNRYVIYGAEESYLASGKNARDLPTGPDIYWTNHCSRTRAFDEAEVKELEGLK